MITRKTRRGMIALVLLTGLSFWAAQEHRDDGLGPVTDLDPKLNYVLRDFEIQFYDEFGQPSLNMRAPLLRNDPDQQIGTIERPVIKLHQVNAVWDLSADTATVTADKEHIHLFGQVNVQRQEPLSGKWSELNTSEVEIQVTPQTATTDQPVSMFDGYNHLSGSGLELDLKTDTFALKQQVKATYAVN